MAFVGESIEPGSVVHTDGWLGYEPLEGDGYRHEVRSYLEGQPARASKLLPRVHRVVSLVKRWILGTHQGAVSHEHLDSYLSTNSPSASTAASPEVEASSFTAWFNRPSPCHRHPTMLAGRRHRDTRYGRPQHLGAISQYLSQVNTHLGLMPVALDDLAALVAPRRGIICERSAMAGEPGQESFPFDSQA